MFTGGFDVMFYVRDAKRSVRFYCDVLGFELLGVWDDENHRYAASFEEAPHSHFAEVRGGGLDWKLHGTDDEIRAGGAVYHLGVEDVDGLHARLVENGFEPTAPQDMPWGWRMSFVKDPDGHVLGFFQPLG